MTERTLDFYLPQFQDSGVINCPKSGVKFPEGLEFWVIKINSGIVVLGYHIHAEEMRFDDATTVASEML